jgi:hypothetical protein
MTSGNDDQHSWPRVIGTVIGFGLMLLLFNIVMALLGAPIVYIQNSPFGK